METPDYTIVIRKNAIDQMVYFLRVTQSGRVGLDPIIENQSVMFSGRVGSKSFNPRLDSTGTQDAVVIDPDNVPLDYRVFRGAGGQSFSSAADVLKYIRDISTGYLTTYDVTPVGKLGLRPLPPGSPFRPS